MLRNSVSAIGLGLLASPLLITGQAVNSSAEASPAAPTVTLSASPTSMPNGQSSTLTWTSANATACSGTGKGFSPSGASGSLAVSPGVATTYGISCAGAGGSASQSVTVTVTPAARLTVGMTVAAVATSGTTLVYSTPTPNMPVIGGEASGNEGMVIGGPVSNSATWWQVAFDDDLTGWVSQGGLAAASPNAPTLTFSANPPSVAPGASSTLSWTSTNATSCSGTGFSPSGASGSRLVSPTVSTTYSITCTGSGGSTAESAAVIVNPPPRFTWKQSLPVTFNNPAIVPLGGTETRALVWMDGSLYAAIGDSEDPLDNRLPTVDTKILRLDSAIGTWVPDQNFIAAATNNNGTNKFWAPAAMAAAHFDKDLNNNPITPVDVLLVGFWPLNTTVGNHIAAKTVTSGSFGAQGTWIIQQPTTIFGSAQTRSFTSYTDSVTNQEMAFAGIDVFGIASGAFNSSTNTIQWGANPEAGTPALMQEDNGNARVMSFAQCNGKLYATIYDNVVVRTDGPNPSWNVLSTYSGPPLLPASSGYRGLTCVNVPGQPPGDMMLIAATEGNGDIYEIPLDGSPATLELNTANFIASNLGASAGYVVTAYNNMTVYPQSGTATCPDLLIGVGYPSTMLIRHCNGTYDFQSIYDTNLSPVPAVLSPRSIVPSQFAGDPPGTLYAGGYDCHGQPAHNTAWIYKGMPTNPLGKVAKH